MISSTGGMGGGVVGDGVLTSSIVSVGDLEGELEVVGYSLGELEMVGYSLGELEMVGYSLGELETVGDIVLQMEGAAVFFQPEGDGQLGHSRIRLAPLWFTLSLRAPPDQTLGAGAGAGAGSGASHAPLPLKPLELGIFPLELFEAFPPLLSMELWFFASSTLHSGGFHSSSGVLQLFCLVAV